MFYSRFFVIFQYNYQNFGIWLGTCHQFEGFQGLSWNFLISWVPNSLRRSTIREATRPFPLGDSNLLVIHLWWREIVLKHGKVYKYFVQDCINNLFSDSRYDILFTKEIIRFTLGLQNRLHFAVLLSIYYC